MSTAAPVPQTRGLTGDLAVRTLRQCGLRRVASDAYVRFRYADGFSHARALAFQLTLTLIPGAIGAAGLAATLHARGLAAVVAHSLARLAPGPAVALVGRAGSQGVADASTAGGRIALVGGLAAAAVSAVTAMGQLERGMNRVYGVERDRPTLAKYAHAARLAGSAGVCALAGSLALVSGSAIAAQLHHHPGLHPVAVAWDALRYPAAVALALLGFAELFRVAPHRRQPSLRWLAVGAAAAVVVWLGSTLLLALYVGSSRVGRAYGPLVDVVTLLVYLLAVSVALLYGAALNAQLEAVRAGSPGPVRPPGTPDLEAPAEGAPGAADPGRPAPGRAGRG